MVRRKRGPQKNNDEGSAWRCPVGDGPRSFAKSASRTLDVLEYLCAAGEPVRASDIANGVGMPRSSADQLLKTLTTSGHLVMLDDKRYFPSIRFARLGRSIAACYPRLDRWHAIQDRLHEEFGETVTLTMQNDCFMQVMRTARSRDYPTVDEGARVPIVGSAVGGACLSTKPERIARTMLARARRRDALLAGSDSERTFLEDVRLSRTMGYSRRLTRWSKEGQTLDCWSVAMALPDSAGADQVVLGMAGPVQRVRPMERRIVNSMLRLIRSTAPQTAAG